MTNLFKKFTGPGGFQRLRIWLAYGGWKDLWLIVVTALVLFAVIQSGNALDQVQKGRKIAITDQCHNDQAQDDVLRALIRASLRQNRERYPRKDPFGRTDADRTTLAEALMAPLGGLELTAEEARRACQQQLIRAKAE